MQKQESTGLRAASASGIRGGLLTRQQRSLLRTALAGRLFAVCYGAGVDSTALLVALKLADLRPDIITFADLLSEKPETIAHLERMQSILARWGWPPITICRKRTLPGTGYDDLYGNCIANETLPSLAFGMRSCSIKWKQKPRTRRSRAASPVPTRVPLIRSGWKRSDAANASSS